MKQILPSILFSMIILLTSCQSRTNIQRNSSIVKMEDQNAKVKDLDSNATVIYRDQKDNLWFASRETGVYKYDGENLTLFTSKDGLGSYRIIRVQEDTKGVLYFDTPEGVFVYEGNKMSRLEVFDGDVTENSWKSDPNDLWFQMGWNHDGPFRFDGKKLYALKFPKNEKEEEFFRQYPNSSFNPYGIYTLFQDRKGNIWFGTSSMGLYLFDGKEISWFYEEQMMKTPEGGDFGIRSIAEDRDGYYWICNANYRYKLHPNKNGKEELKSINLLRDQGIDQQGRENLYFLSMESDKEGNILMYANEDGIWLNDGSNLMPFYIKDGKSKITPTSMFKDNRGVFWFGTAQNGIYSYDGHSFKKLEL